MFGLAKETGWSESFILDEPLAKIWAYRHALLRSYDAETYFVTNDDEKKALYELFGQL